MLLAFVDTPQKESGLIVFPVVSADEPDLSYLLLADALRSGLLTLEEEAHEDTHWVIARNLGNLPVLILDCETMTGSGTERATSQSVLLGPDSVTRVPTACAGGNRWSSQELEGRYSPSLGNFPLLENQVGIMAFLGQHLLGMDVLGSPVLYRSLHGRLLAGYLHNAPATGESGNLEPGGEGGLIQALAWALEGAERVDTPCPGHGEYSLLQGSVTGGELRHNGHLVHLSVFPRGAAA